MNAPLNIDWQQILLHAFNFIILAAGLIFLLYKPVRDFMRKRENGYKAAKKSADENREEALRLSNEIAMRKAAADKEVEAYRLTIISKANAEAEAKISEAKARADKLLPEATLYAETVKNGIIKSSEGDITDMVICASEKLSSYSATAATDSNIYDCFINTANKQEDKKDD